MGFAAGHSESRCLFSESRAVERVQTRDGNAGGLSCQRCAVSRGVLGRMADRCILCSACFEHVYPPDRPDPETKSLHISHNAVLTSAGSTAVAAHLVYVFLSLHAIAERQRTRLKARAR